MLGTELLDLGPEWRIGDGNNSQLDLGYAYSEEIVPTDSVASFHNGVHINTEKLKACLPKEAILNIINGFGASIPDYSHWIDF